MQHIVHFAREKGGRLREDGVGGRILAGALWLLVGTAMIAGATLVPVPSQAAQSAATPVACLVCGELGAVDVTLNVLLFVPLGIGLGLMGLRPRGAILAAFATTLAVEAAQFTVIEGRDASLSDVLTNSAGGWLGAALALHWRAWLLPDEGRAARGPALLAGLAWLGVAALSCIAMRAAPTDRPYYGHVPADLDNFERFAGSVHAARAAGVALDSGPITSWRRVAEALRRKAFTMEAAIRPDTEPVARAPFALLTDESGDVIALLAQQRDDVVFDLRTVAAVLRLRTPGVRLRHVLAAGREVHVTGTFDGRSLGLVVRSDRGEIAFRAGLGPHVGWALWLPFRLEVSTGTRWLDAAWTGGWALLVAWFVGRAFAAYPGMAVAIVGVHASVVLGLLPIVAGLAPAPVHVVVATVCCALLGVLAGRLLAPPAGSP